MTKIFDLLSEYGNSPEDVKKILGQLRGAIQEEQPALAKTPTFYASDEAKSQFGIHLPAPDYMLKSTPDKTRPEGYRLSYVTPSNYNI